MEMFDLTNLGLDDAVEPQAVAEGEYKLRVTEVRVGTYTDKESQAEVGYWALTCEVAEHPEAKEVRQGRTFIAIPNSNMTPKKLNSARLGLDYMLKAFEIEVVPNFNPEEALPGREAWGLLGVEEDETYGPQNFVKRWIIPQE